MGPGLAIIGAALALGVSPHACPAGVPAQTITVVNQAHVRPAALARVESAVTDQSMQLRAAWGTPCVVFAPGGWPLILRIGGTTSGVHYGAEPSDPLSPAPNAIVYTGGYGYRGWSEDFSHEVVEMLVDPVNTDYTLGAESSQLEVADPVEKRGYGLDGVYVTDFALPAWYAGATYLVGVQAGPQIAPAGAAGPYDEMRVLSAPWQAG